MSEEDLKIIQEFIEDFEKDNVILSIKGIRREKEYKAIKNLIQENKELKENLEEKDMQHELELIGKEEYTKDAMAEIIEHYYTANEDCIPRSKVKEKIEEINKILDRNLLVDKLRNYFTAKKEALQELLEGGDDK